MAKEKNINTYIHLGIVIVIFLITYFFVYPAVLEVKNNKKDLLISQKTIEQKENTLSKFKEVSVKYKAAQSDFQKLNQMLPSEPDIVSQLIQIETLTGNNGLIMEDISFGSWQASKENQVGILPVNLEVTGSYSAFKNFLEAIAKNLNLMDVEAISFQPSKEGEEKYTFSLVINTYTENLPVSAASENAPEQGGTSTFNETQPTGETNITK